MRILYIVHENKKGGAAQSFLDMIQGVSKEHDVYVITPHKRGYIPDKLNELGILYKTEHYFWWEIAKTGNAAIDIIRFFIYRILSIYNYVSARFLADRAKRMGIDVIHSNSSTISIGALISELANIPHVWHLRELGYQDFSLIPVNSNNSLEKIINRGNSQYIAISEYVKKYYGEFVDDCKIHVVYNGISSAYNYMKCEEDYNLGKVLFLIAGNYCEEKGQINVAHAVKLLVSQGIVEFKVYMAGRGDFSNVKKYLEEKDISEYVIFCGLVDDMLALRKKCDVEIVASKAEAFGRVTVEAMRASNPVIGSATGGTTELIQNGVTGFLYEYKNDQALAECMKRFIDKPKLAYEMGINAYEWSIDKFTSEENVSGVIRVYTRMVDRKT